MEWPRQLPEGFSRKNNNKEAIYLAVWPEGKSQTASSSDSRSNAGRQGGGHKARSPLDFLLLGGPPVDDFLLLVVVVLAFYKKTPA